MRFGQHVRRDEAIERVPGDGLDLSKKMLPLLDAEFIPPAQHMVLPSLSESGQRGIITARKGLMVRQ